MPPYTTQISPSVRPVNKKKPPQSRCPSKRATRIDNNPAGSSLVPAPIVVHVSIISCLGGEECCLHTLGPWGPCALCPVDLSESREWSARNEAIRNGAWTAWVKPQALQPQISSHATNYSRLSDPVTWRSVAVHGLY